MRVAAEELFFC